MIARLIGGPTKRSGAAFSAGCCDRVMATPPMRVMRDEKDPIKLRRLISNALFSLFICKVLKFRRYSAPRQFMNFLFFHPLLQMDFGSNLRLWRIFNIILSREGDT